MSKSHVPTLEPRRSYVIESSANGTSNQWKSDVCLNNEASYTIFTSLTGTNISIGKHKPKEYYKRYEHDEVPVKLSKGKPSFVISDNTNKSITNSDLDRLEHNIYQTISQDLKLEQSSASSLESNIKFFKSTIQEIFNTFQTNLRDYDIYKQRLNEILTKTQKDSISDMENFIKEMIQNIISSEPSAQSIVTNDNKAKIQVEVQDCETSTALDNESKTDTLNSNKTFDVSYNESVQVVVESYKNDNYYTDSTLNDIDREGVVVNPTSSSTSKRHIQWDNRQKVMFKKVGRPWQSLAGSVQSLKKVR